MVSSQFFPTLFISKPTPISLGPFLLHLYEYIQACPAACTICIEISGLKSASTADGSDCLFGWSSSSPTTTSNSCTSASQHAHGFRIANLRLTYSRPQWSYHECLTLHRLMTLTFPYLPHLWNSEVQLRFPVEIISSDKIFNHTPSPSSGYFQFLCRRVA